MCVDLIRAARFAGVAKQGIQKEMIGRQDHMKTTHKIAAANPPKRDSAGTNAEISITFQQAICVH